MKPGSIILIGAGGLAAFMIGKSLMKLKNTGDQIETTLTNARIHKIDGSGLTFKTGVAIKNPTDNSVTISQPFVKLTSNGELLASSNVSSEKTVIKPKNITSLSQDISITLPWTKLLPYASNIVSLVGGFIKSWKDGNNAALLKSLKNVCPMEMSYQTKVNDSINYSSDPVKIL